MTEAELSDLEECSEMFDFCGFTPEEDKRLITEVRRLQLALKRHGRHQLLECDLFRVARRKPDTACTCGLDEALAGGPTS